MKNSKRILAMAMACAMSLSLATAALAAEGDPAATSATVTKAGGMDAGDKGTTATFTATIKPTILSVKIPTTVAFNLDNSKAAWDTMGTDKSPSTMQVSEPELTIENAGATPVYVYVSGVTATDGAVLTDTIANVNDNTKNVLFGLTTTEAPKAAVDSHNLDAMNWMTTSIADTDGNRYYLDNADGKATPDSAAHGKIDAATTGGDATKLNFHIMCVARHGWSAEDTFSVKPVFTVSVTEPDATPAP